MLIIGGCQEGSITRTVILTLAEDRAPVHLHLRKHLLQFALLRWSHIRKLIYVDIEIMSERHLGIKLIGKVDVVEEILSQMIRQQAIGEGTLAATLLADKHRSGFVAMKHIHLQPVGNSRTEPGGAPSQLFACQPRNSAKEFSHMVLTIPFRQVLEIFPDRVKLRNLFRTYELLNILSGRLLASHTQPLGMTDDGIESLRSQHLPGRVRRFLLFPTGFRFLFYGLLSFVLIL